MTELSLDMHKLKNLPMEEVNRLLHEEATKMFGLGFHPPERDEWEEGRDLTVNR